MMKYLVDYENSHSERCRGCRLLKSYTYTGRCLDCFVQNYRNAYLKEVGNYTHLITRDPITGKERTELTIPTTWLT